MFLTIFTPTYNRIKYLPILYQSLLNQTFKDFEWVIVDDGSTDCTQEQIEKWSQENKIQIKFLRQENAGKHIAINNGAAIASGDLFFTVDSDDYLAENAVERIYFHWNNVHQLQKESKNRIIGLGANRVYPNGTVIGGVVNYDILDTDLLDLRFVKNVKGDKAEIYLTSVVKNNPFPKFEGETFCPESLIFYRLAEKGYTLRFFNENIYVGEYIEGGLTRGSFSTIRRGPIASLRSYADVVGFSKVSFYIKIKYAILFWRFSFYDKKQSGWDKVKMLPNFIYSIFYPIGLLFYLKDKINIR